MLLGKVTGTVVCTQKDEKLSGLTFQIVSKLDSKGKEKGDIVVAADSVGAGIGEVVLMAAGSSARQTLATDGRPVDAVIMAIVDTYDVEGTIVYDKSQ